MFKKKLFGYSKKQVDLLIRQMENDFDLEEEILKEKINKLEVQCQLLKNENDEDKDRLFELRNNRSTLTRFFTNMFEK